MLKQNVNTETVDFRFVLTDKPGAPRILAAKWLKLHKTEVLDFLTRALKPEIITDNGANPNQIHGAKVESAAFFRYMAEALGAQIAIDRGELPAIDRSPISQIPIPPAQASSPIPLPIPSPKEETLDEDNDDDNWDDDEVIMTTNF